MACKQGIRQNIEQSKLRQQEEQKYDPFRALWSSLVSRDRNVKGGHQGFTRAERLYFALRVLEREVYNGGMEQFFWNSSGNLFGDVIEGLTELDAPRTRALTLQAKEIIFGELTPPSEATARREHMKQAPTADVRKKLDEIDRAFCADPEKLGERLDAFARNSGLLTAFEQGAGGNPPRRKIDSN